MEVKWEVNSLRSWELSTACWTNVLSMGIVHFYSLFYFLFYFHFNFLL